MLGKLFKYEFRATGRVFLPMYAVLLVMSAVARLFYYGGLRNAVAGGMAETRITVIVSMVMVMLFTAVWVVTLVIIIRRFWVNLLGREGYLMNILPVSPWEHVFSKLITSTVWTILGMIVSAAALLIMLGATLETIFNIRWAYLADYWNTGWWYLREQGADAQAVLLAILFPLSALLNILSFILTAYAAMCVGQTVNRHRVWASIGAFFGISIVQSILSSWLLAERLENHFSYAGIFWSSDNAATRVYDVLSSVNTELLLYLLFTLAVSAILFFVSQLLLKNRLNLQ